MSKFSSRNRFWFKKMFIYAQVRFQLVYSKLDVIECVLIVQKIPVLIQPVSLSVCADETPAVIYLKNWTLTLLLMDCYERPWVLPRCEKSALLHVLHFRQPNWKNRKNEMVMCVLVLRWTETKKSMLHGSISRAVKPEKEKEERDRAEEVCRWGCGYTVSVSSIDWKSAG